MFDFDILLFCVDHALLISHFICSHVSIKFQSIHIYISLFSLLVWRTKIGIRTGPWWRYRFEK